MKPARKIPVVLTIIALLVSLFLSACSKTDNSGAGQQPQDTGKEEKTAENKPEGKTSIRFSIWYGTGDIEIWKQVISRFEAKNPDIKVNFEPLEFNAYWQKLQTQLASKSAPDVVGMHVGLVFNYADKGQLEPLEPYIKSGNADLSSIPDPLLAEGQWPKDKPTQYALPWRFTGGPLFVNLTAFKEAGIPYPENGWTIDEFLDAAKKLTNDKRYGFLAPSFTMNTSLMGAFGGEPTTPDKMHSNFNSPEVLEFKTFIHDLIFKYKVSPNPKDLDSKVDAFASGKVAMAYNGAWMFPVYREIKDFEWDIAPNPTKDGKSKTYVGPDMISITKDSKNKEAAWKFIQYAVFDPEAQDLLSTTGLPILKKDLTDQKKIEAIAAKKPAHYKVFLDEAMQNGSGYAFTTQFFEISKLEQDADYKILRNPNADIKKELEDLHEKVNKLFEKK